MEANVAIADVANLSCFETFRRLFANAWTACGLVSTFPCDIVCLSGSIMGYPCLYAHKLLLCCIPCLFNREHRVSMAAGRIRPTNDELVVRDNCYIVLRAQCPVNSPTSVELALLVTQKQGSCAYYYNRRWIQWVMSPGSVNNYQ